mgnify:CR=1 FL=1
MARSHRSPRRQRADLLWQLLLALGLGTRLAVSAYDHLGFVVAGVGGGVQGGFAPPARAAGRRLTLAGNSASLARRPAFANHRRDLRRKRGLCKPLAFTPANNAADFINPACQAQSRASQRCVAQSGSVAPGTRVGHPQHQHALIRARALSLAGAHQKAHAD